MQAVEIRRGLDFSAYFLLLSRTVVGGQGRTTSAVVVEPALQPAVPIRRWCFDSWIDPDSHISLMEVLRLVPCQSATQYLEQNFRVSAECVRPFHVPSPC